MRFTHYVSLGDSISTDDYPGERCGAASLFYRNNEQLYPELKGHDLASLYPKIEFVPLAQDGATSIHVISEQLPELKKIRRPGRVLFTLTAGGNDILAERDTADKIASRIRNIITTLTETYPSCLILPGTVYDPTDGGGDLFEPGLSREREMNILVELNRTILNLQAPGIEVVDIHKRFLGHGLKYEDAASPFYHPDDASLWYLLTIEPNLRGAHEIRKLFLEKLNQATHRSL